MSNTILIRPLVTEKLTELMEQGQYAFQVAKHANKVQIRKAIEQRYPGVRITDVRTMVVRGKRRRQQSRRGLVQGRTASYKKAIVSVDPEGQQIDFFENV